MVRKILVAYDTSALSGKAIDEAKIQAKLVENSQLYIVTVVTPGITTNNTAASGNLSMNDAEMIYPKLEKIKKALEASGYTVHIEIITDFSQRNPGVAICDYVEEHAIDMVIVGHRGLSNLKKLFLGSVSGTIVQRAASQVLVIK
ncbi:universal stress protein [Oceanobacillus alkalisoli]|uniref:universal stress protein n=1 Tax=Oceanobacillus alkalisoli TaxID=2925113 RepID=UPI001EF08C75|nr:universal stress protein [Oceanobacillus alkalisoli]MCF3941967.1 universal stress protein [Oceanobacillus alkalisoli]MCG5102080.1 universal stress protein [Oceanobacillus alkalisoli]